jgi:3-methyladenine DNA glycosylase/8-oxoguanine DNA glycosylase
VRRSTGTRIHLQKCLDSLRARHPRLKLLLEVVGDIEFQLPKWDSVDDAVVYCIIGQMLSGPATRSIIRRLREHFGDSGEIIKWCSQTAFRDGPLLGVSQRKRKAFHAWK